MDNLFILLQIIFSLAITKIGIDHLRKIRQKRLDRLSTAPPRSEVKPLIQYGIAGSETNRRQEAPPSLPKKRWWSVYRYSLGSIAFVVLFEVGRVWFI